MRFIDPPTPFAPRKEWEEFLKEMESIEPKDEAIREAIQEAKEWLDRSAQT